MSSAFSARRRAERFDALVGRPAASADDPRLAELLDVVGALRSVPAPAPRPEFSAALRERLMAEADTALLPRHRTLEERLALPATARTPRSRRDRRLAVAAGTLAVVGASTSMAAAAQTALPGEALYPVKRAIEEAHAEVSVGEDAKGSTMLANAAGRLAEVVELARIGTPESTAAVPPTLHAFVEQSEEAAGLKLEDYVESGNADSITELRDFASSSMGALADLEEALPTSAHGDLRAAAEVLAEIDAAAARLCPTCGGSGITEVPLSLLATGSRGFGALPAGGQPSGHDSDTPTGVRGPGRPATSTTSSGTADGTVPQTGGEIRSPGSVFASPSGGGTATDTGTGTGGSGGGLRDLLTVVSTSPSITPSTGPGRTTTAPVDGPALDPVLDGSLVDGSLVDGSTLDPVTGPVDDALLGD